jgi:hypothetical protein
MPTDFASSIAAKSALRNTIFGFEKTDRDNICAKELGALKALASDLLRLGGSELSAAVAANTLREICYEN